MNTPISENLKIVETGQWIKSNMESLATRRTGFNPSGEKVMEPLDIRELSSSSVSDFLFIPFPPATREGLKGYPGIYQLAAVYHEAAAIKLAENQAYPSNQLKILDEYYFVNADIFGSLLQASPLGEQLRQLAETFVGQFASTDPKPRPRVDLSQGPIGPTGMGGC